MKKIGSLVFVFALTGCISTYQGTNSKEVAYVSVPKTETSYKLIGGFSGQNVGVGDINEKGCMVNVGKVNSGSLNKDNMLVVPAGREIGLYVSAYQGNTSCGLGIAVTLENSKNYKLVFGQGYSSCGVDIVEVVGEKVVRLESEKLHPGFSSLCKK